MRRAAAILGALALVVSTAGVLAQAKPDFSGTWTLVPAEGGGGGGGGRGGGRGGGGGGCGQSCTITQDATTLKIDRSMGDQTVSMSYKLDGSESTNTITMGRGGEQTQTSTATWQGSNLVITTAGGRGGPTTMTLSMANGMLTIATTRTPGRGGDPVTTSQQYKKN